MKSKNLRLLMKGTSYLFADYCATVSEWATQVSSRRSAGRLRGRCASLSLMQLQITRKHTLLWHNCSVPEAGAPQLSWVCVVSNYVTSVRRCERILDTRNFKLFV